nr:ulp1 protease family, C-terminal catalytic domain-containing protein [Tanacetum cinerariifolium]
MQLHRALFPRCNSICSCQVKKKAIEPKFYFHKPESQFKYMMVVNLSMTGPPRKEAGAGLPIEGIEVPWSNERPLENKELNMIIGAWFTLWRD